MFCILSPPNRSICPQNIASASVSLLHSSESRRLTCFLQTSQSNHSLSLNHETREVLDSFFLVIAQKRSPPCLYRSELAHADSTVNASKRESQEWQKRREVYKKEGKGRGEGGIETTRDERTFSVYKRGTRSITKERERNWGKRDLFTTLKTSKLIFVAYLRFKFCLRSSETGVEEGERERTREDLRRVGEMVSFDSVWQIEREKHAQSERERAMRDSGIRANS